MDTWTAVLIILVVDKQERIAVSLKEGRVFSPAVIVTEYDCEKPSGSKNEIERMGETIKKVTFKYFV